MFHCQVMIYTLVIIGVRELPLSFLYVKVTIPNYNGSTFIGAFNNYVSSLLKSDEGV